MSLVRFRVTVASCRAISKRLTPEAPGVSLVAAAYGKRPGCGVLRRSVIAGPST